MAPLHTEQKEVRLDLDQIRVLHFVSSRVARAFGQIADGAHILAPYPACFSSSRYAVKLYSDSNTLPVSLPNASICCFLVRTTILFC